MVTRDTGKVRVMNKRSSHEREDGGEERQEIFTVLESALHFKEVTFVRRTEIRL